MKVIQWATGNIGTRSLRTVIEHPQMELVGLWVSSPNKVGQDAGQLCGLADTGIIATNDVDQLVATQADAVLYMRQGTDIDELCRLLASGKNIITTRGDFHHPPMMDGDVRAKIEAACAAGNSSIYSTGSSPGFSTEALILPLLSLQRRLDGLIIDEYADMISRDSPDLLFQVMGFGDTLGDFDPRKIDHVRDNFVASLAQVADAAGIKVDEWTAHGELAAATQRVEIAAGVIEEGRVAAQRITVSALRGGKAVLSFRANWYVTPAIDADWDLRESGWRIRVQGDTPLDVGITYPVSREDYPAFTPGLTAHRAVNSVFAVCAAAAGIRTTVDLPQIVAQL
jgi:hypothetical protein